MVNTRDLIQLSAESPEPIFLYIQIGDKIEPVSDVKVIIEKSMSDRLPNGANQIKTTRKIILKIEDHGKAEITED